MHSLIMRLTDSSGKTVLLASFLLSLIGYIDYATGYEISFSFFYLIPVLLVVWRKDLRAGLVFSFLCALVWFLNDHWLNGRPYSRPLIPYWNSVVRFAFFALFSVLAARIKSLLGKERAQSDLKSSMLHVVSHDFNNSLTILASGLFLLRETEPGGADPARLKILAALDETRGQMARYVKNVLNQARMESGRFVLERSPLALREIVNEAVTAMSGVMATKGLEFELRAPESPIIVNADRDALALVIGNLLANAVKYTPAKGRITVGVSPLGEPAGAVRFFVEDTGIGISMGEIDRIMTGFYRTESGKGAAEGFGMGLRITNELLELHGSRLEVLSEKGKGSRFFFELPVQPPGG